MLAMAAYFKRVEFIFSARRRARRWQRVLILCAPSCGLDQMFAELQAATARGMPEIGLLVAIAAEYAAAIEPPAD
jgi:hypothetical protein